MLGGFRTSTLHSSILCLGVGRGQDSGVTAFTTVAIRSSFRLFQIQGVIDVTTNQNLERRTFLEPEGRGCTM